MDKEIIIILHGLKKGPRHMKRMARLLEKEGFEVLNLAYASTKFSLKELSKKIFLEIKHLVGEEKVKIHFVGYSLGGILSRMILHENEIPNLGRVVLLGTPNAGSKIVDKIGGNFVYSLIFGPAAEEISEKNMSLKSHDLFGERMDFEIGVLAGTGVRSFLASFLLESKEHDGRVAVENTKFPGMTDHLVMKSNHCFMPYRKKFVNQTVHFLRYGKFYHEENVSFLQKIFQRKNDKI